MVKVVREVGNWKACLPPKAGPRVRKSGSPKDRKSERPKTESPKDGKTDAFVGRGRLLVKQPGQGTPTRACVYLVKILIPNLNPGGSDSPANIE